MSLLRALRRIPRSSLSQAGGVWPQPAQKQDLRAQRCQYTRLKDLFVEQVEQIVWQYKLAPETINLPARRGCRKSRSSASSSRHRS
jgi:hypothetical protein